eukprot:tig00000545_g2000.t1
MDPAIQISSVVAGLLHDLELEGAPAEEYARQLLENVSDFAVTKASAAQTKRKLLSLAQAPSLFNAKYEELKNSQQFPELDRILAVVAKVREDPGLQSLLCSSAAPLPPGTGPPRPSATPAASPAPSRPSAAATPVMPPRGAFSLEAASPEAASAAPSYPSTAAPSAAGTPQRPAARPLPADTSFAATVVGSAVNGNDGDMFRTPVSTRSAPATAAGDGGGSSSAVVSPDFKKKLDAVTAAAAASVASSGPFAALAAAAAAAAPGQAGLRTPQGAASGPAGKGRRRGNTPAFPEWTRTRPYLSSFPVVDKSDKSAAELAMSSPSLYPAGPSAASPPRKQQGPSLHALPYHMQELAIMDDLLYVMMGIEGKYIGIVPTTTREGHRDVSFKVDKTLDVSLAELVGRVLPLAAQHVRVASYADHGARYEAGLVANALSAALRSLCKEFLVLVAQLEHQYRLGRLSLQKLWFFVQPAMQSMEVLDRVACEARRPGVSGGALLNALHALSATSGGDKASRDLFAFLLERASAPYFEMLQSWIYTGKFRDPYGEFMIEENERLRKENVGEDFNDKYWEQRYTLEWAHVPEFLKKYAEKILTTGKYLNVVAECGRRIDCPFAGEGLAYTAQANAYGERIERAHGFASAKLLGLLLEENQLLARLRSLRRYLLVGHGDFLVHFMDLAEDELAKPAHEVAVSKLESLLGIALNTSASAGDPFKEDLRCSVVSYTLIKQLVRVGKAAEMHPAAPGMPPTPARPTPLEAEPEPILGSSKIKGVEGFVLDYRVGWPLSLVVSRKAVTKYQLLFRHIFYAKHVERRLCAAWLSHHSTKEIVGMLGPTPGLARAFCLRQRMLHFLHQLLHYVTYEVIEPNAHEFETKFRTVGSVDEVLRLHEDFLDVCLKQCMLTAPSTHQTLTKILATCVNFGKFTEEFTRGLAIASSGAGSGASADPTGLLPPARLREARARARVTGPGGREYGASVARFESDFGSGLATLMEALTEAAASEGADPHLASLVTRLDFNGYYGQSFGRLPSPALAWADRS